MYDIYTEHAEKGIVTLNRHYIWCEVVNSNVQIAT